MHKKFSIGVDIGGTNVAYGIVDNSGSILYEKWWTTQSIASIEDLANKIMEDLKNNPDFDMDDCKGIGIGAPSANSKTGCIHHAANLLWTGIVPVVSVFESIFQIPIRLANDANAAAMGEGIYGGAKGISNYAMITIGTGIGSGIICNGLIIQGFDGNGGEFGHMIVQEDGRKCGCGRRGCLETYTSASGIKTTASELAQQSEMVTPLTVFIRSGNEFDSKLIFDYLLDGDLLAKEVFKVTGIALGKAIANLVTLLGLEKVFLFGGPVKAGDHLITPIRDAFNEHVIMYYQNKVAIEVSQLQERNTALLGAASLVAT